MSSKVAFELKRRTVLALLVEIALGLHLPRLSEGKLTVKLGHLGVAMHSGKDVTFFFQRVDDGIVMELFSKLQPTNIASVTIKIGQYFIHAAKFGCQHFLDMLIVRSEERRV